ncbi:putative ras-responsive element-binding protein 1 [Penaeus vannamei]|uniref:Putative ras-responsive element-binding protein 1 n=1 Tax=Penaeus vannamei TaxID=6689 RepID=A0A3R7MD46_PENVA|nr:putative ras-responsive element-binding protein 1 [Penaeus vannamei]
MTWLRDRRGRSASLLRNRGDAPRPSYGVRRASATQILALATTSSAPFSRRDGLGLLCSVDTACGSEGEGEAGLTGNFSCPVCEEVLPAQHEFTQHIRKHNHVIETDNGTKVYCCGICKKQLSSNSSLDRHMLAVRLNASEVEEEELTCPACGVEQPSQHALEQHVENIHPEYQVACTTCQWASKNYRALHLHNSMVHHTSTASPPQVDLTLTDFSSPKFPLIAKEICERTACTSSPGRGWGAQVPVVPYHIPLRRVVAHAHARARRRLHGVRLLPQVPPVRPQLLQRGRAVAPPPAPPVRGAAAGQGGLPQGAGPPQAAGGRVRLRHLHGSLHLRQRTGAAPEHAAPRPALARAGRLREGVPEHPSAGRIAATTTTTASSVAPLLSTAPGLSHDEQFARGYREMKLNGQYPCKLCKEVFANAQAEVHNLVHMVAPPYRCNLCSFFSNDKNTLKEHMKSHKGDTPYECNLCNLAFTHQGQLRAPHQEHPRAPVADEVKGCMTYVPQEEGASTDRSLDTVCHICHIDCKARSVLRDHIRSSHPEGMTKPFSCKLCGGAFSSENDVMRHVIQQHSEAATGPTLDSLVVSQAARDDHQDHHDLTPVESLLSFSKLPLTAMPLTTSHQPPPPALPLPFSHNAGIPTPLVPGRTLTPSVTPTLTPCPACSPLATRTRLWISA